MGKNNYENLKIELKKLWNEERANNFFNEIVEKIDEDQMECLSKMIIYIAEKTPDLDEIKLREIVGNLDTFDGPLEFLEYFFKMTQPDLVESTMENLKADPEEVIDMLESIEDQGIIEYLVEFGSFYVWYKG
ncbi:MAG: hypothetical protein WBG30_02525 [Psychrilyobacter sp.]|uniref:hypothetical protein n=1 Tax=Psychrilyobacter sp. TaxID=2586924 RepID=UPI003C76932C